MEVGDKKQGGLYLTSFVLILLEVQPKEKALQHITHKSLVFPPPSWGRGK